MSDPYEADFVDDTEEVDPLEDELDELDEPDEEIDEPAEPDDVEDDEPPARAAKPARKSFAQRVDEVASRRVAEVEARLRAELTPRQQPTETQAQRQARLAELEPWERTEFLVNERLAASEAQTNERLDRQYFESLCARDPIAAGMKDEVERELSALRARGQNVDRDTMLTFLLGQKARQNSGRATGRAAKAAAQRRERQAVRPGSGRSDTPAADRREANTKAARDKRLENYQL